jgi:hypothetical protein
MAVYKIFPKKDASIYSQYPLDNFGRDEILEISSYNDYVSRTLIKFDENELSSIISQSNGIFSSSLKLYLSEANIPQSFNIEIYPILQDWKMGTGRNKDIPNPQNGVCWDWPDYTNTSVSWGSYFDINDVITQSFDYYGSKDIDCDITSILSSWNSGSITNHGLLLKLPNNLESSSQDLNTSFFSIDTHTIYPPHIEIKWDDVIFSSSLPEISNTNFETSISNNRANFKENEIYKFIINSRDKYPTRNFQTSSLYLDNKILPSESYWALKDYKTKEIIIDFDTIGTKLGVNNEGNYFNIYMNGLQPDRFYQILLKTKINEEVVIIDKPSYIFKIIK